MPGFASRYQSVRHSRESACVMLSKASPAKWARLWTCGSWRWPQVPQYSPASGAPQLPHTMVCGAGTSGGLTTGTGVSDIDGSGDLAGGRGVVAAIGGGG